MADSNLEKPTYLAYVDEAGTAPCEPVRVVAGIIIQPGDQLRALEHEITRLLDQYVPPKFRAGHVFHATKLFSGDEFREEWGDNRWNLLVEMTSLPRRLSLPISYAMIRSGSFLKETYDVVAAARRPLTPHNFDHASAFAFCAAAADRHLRRAGSPAEWALVAANVDGMKAAISTAVEILRLQAIHLPPQLVRHDVSDISPEVLESGVDLKIAKLLDSPIFKEQRDDPLLQLADATAFAIRRWITELRHGKELMSALLSMLPPIADFSGGSSSGTWSFDRRPAPLNLGVG